MKPNNPEPHRSLEFFCSSHFDPDAERCAHCPSILGNEERFNEHCERIKANYARKLLEQNEQHTRLMESIAEHIHNMRTDVNRYTKWMPRAILLGVSVALTVLFSWMLAHGVMDKDLYWKFEAVVLSPFYGPVIGNTVRVALKGDSEPKDRRWSLIGVLALLLTAKLFL